MEKASASCSASSGHQSPDLSKTKGEKTSPRTVLEEDRSTSSFGDLSSSSMTDSPPPPPLPPKYRDRPSSGKQHSLFRLFSSLLQSPFDINRRKRRGESFDEESHHQSLLRCFSYAEISNATNNFHPGKKKEKKGEKKKKKKGEREREPFTICFWHTRLSSGKPNEIIWFWCDR